MTIREAKEYFRDGLSTIYPRTEILAFERLVFEEILKFPLAEILLRGDDDFSADLHKQLNEIISKLQQEIPIQYIFGHTEFYDLKLEVNKNVLIPRPETEELVDWIIKENNTVSNLSILDIGTGSGCIILSLARNFTNATCFATDISGAALSIAKQNAKNHSLDVSFTQHDILNDSKNPFHNKYDIIVSNPPYVMQSEKKVMQKNVLGYEPALALFVDDETALKYYISIAEKANKWLKPGGSLYFEINEQKGDEICHLLKSLNYKDVRLKKDINSKDRIASGVIG